MSDMDMGVDSTTASVHYVNEAGVSEDVMADIQKNQEIASAISNWMQRATSSRNSRSYDVFQRSKYQGNDHIFAQMGQCAAAVENDDVLSTLSDTLESLFFQRMRFEMDDEDQEDIWNQIAADIDFDTRFKQFFREVFKVSQCYVGIWWQRKTYRVRTPVLQEGDIDPATGKQVERGPGNRQKKKRFEVIAPTAMTVFDPTKVVPVGNMMFGNERFAYIATKDESDAFEAVMSGDAVDPTVLQLLEGRYQPSEADKKSLGDIGIDIKNLWLFKKDSLFRFTATKADYERFAPVRLKTILEVLDMKQHLRASDRATLIGSTNFIVVIKKGSEKYPARQGEIDNLQEQARVVSRMPILVGDHRLSVEIVTPKLDHTLSAERHWALDSRLVFRAVQSLSPTQQSWAERSAGSNVSEHSRVVALGLESKRSNMVRVLQRRVFAVAMEKNPDQFTEMPHIAFSPKRVTLSLDHNFLNSILKLRDRGDMSRESLLEEVDYDQDVEARRRLQEREVYDPIFQTAVPHSAPGANPFTDGQKGGRPPGVEEENPRAQKGTGEGGKDA